MKKAIQTKPKQTSQQATYNKFDKSINFMLFIYQLVIDDTFDIEQQQQQQQYEHKFPSFVQKVNTWFWKKIYLYKMFSCFTS